MRVSAKISPKNRRIFEFDTTPIVSFPPTFSGSASSHADSTTVGRRDGSSASAEADLGFDTVNCDLSRSHVAISDWGEGIRGKNPIFPYAEVAHLKPPENNWDGRKKDKDKGFRPKFYEKSKRQNPATKKETRPKRDYKAYKSQAKEKGSSRNLLTPPAKTPRARKNDLHSARKPQKPAFHQDVAKPLLQPVRSARKSLFVALCPISDFFLVKKKPSPRR